jgi:autotransporter-associated beta strand protein
MKHKTRFGACLASLALVLPTQANVIYSNLLNTDIPLDFDGVMVNIGNGVLNPFFGGVGVANNATLQPFRNASGGLDTILNLSFGTTIDGSNLHLATGHGGSQDHLGKTFTAGQEGYIGFKLNGANYGWARVVFTNNTGGAMVKDWAYDNSGSPITAGGIRQAGQDLVLSSSFTVASNLQNGGGTTNLIQSGTVTNTLTGTNTYSGNTLVTQGTLAIGGSGSINNSAVTIDGGTFLYNSSVAYTNTLTFTGGTIGGTNFTGSLGGLEIGANQTISPGNSTGMMETTSQTWAGGGTYRWEINNATGIAGSSAAGWDLLAGSGSLDITATGESPFTIAITSLGLNQEDGDAVNFAGLTSYSWLIADFASVVDFATEAFAIDTRDFSNVFTGTFGIARGDSILNGDDSQIYLTYSAIPEPRAALLGGLGLLALLRRRRPLALRAPTTADPVMDQQKSNFSGSHAASRKALGLLALFAGCSGLVAATEKTKEAAVADSNDGFLWTPVGTGCPHD